MMLQWADRNFQLWEFRVSHGSLLIRSPRGPSGVQNIDLIFAGVEYVACPRMLRGLEVLEPAKEDVEKVAEALDCPIDPLRVHVLVSGGRRYLVVAASMRVSENDGDIFESPFD